MTTFASLEHDSDARFSSLASGRTWQSREADGSGRRKILIIGDLCCRDDLAGILDREGFDIEIAPTTATAFNSLSRTSHDLVLLVSLPERLGIETCQHLRHHYSVPILFVDDQSTESMVVLGLEAGAEDYVTRPCRTNEMLARIRAVLRRNSRLQSRSPREQASTCSEVDGIVTIGPMQIDLESRSLVSRDRPVNVTPKEFGLLSALASPPEILHTREELIDQLWERASPARSRALDKHVRRLRAKIEIDPSNPRHLLTVHGLGFRLHA